MAKAKNKRNAGLADKVHKKKKGEGVHKKLNPFEVHINNEKLKVLGKKSKHDRGLPGVSRAKALQKRKETLGTEMKLMNKTNTFIDRRIGEKNNQLSAEDRMVARFAAERARQHGKKNIYNLADDEILTHRGQTLEQIEKFDDPRSDDEEDEDGRKFGGLDNDFVSDGHFGGGILSRTEANDGAKSHKDLIEQLIAESKKRKAEKQKEKEQTLDLTEKLDSEWKDLQPVVFKRARVEEKKEESIIDKLLSKVDKNNQDYDKMMRELKFEKRGTPSDGLKNDEKQAKEEKLKLEQLEKERDRRMHGEDDESAPKLPQVAIKHRSADDLDDNFELEDERQFMLAYDKDGKPLVPEEVLKDYSVPNAKPKFNDGISDTSSDDDDDDDEEDEDNENKGDDVHNEKEESDDENDVEESDSDDSVVKDSKTKANEKSISNKHNNLETKVNKIERGDENSDAEEQSDSDNSDGKKKNKKVGVSKNNEDLKIKTNSKTDVRVTLNTTNEITKVSNQVKEKLNKETNGTIESGNEKSNDDDEGSGEDKDLDEESGESEVDDKLGNLRDLLESEKESADEEDVANDVRKINSFFDLKLAEGENLKDLLLGKTPAQQSSVLQKLIKSYDPGLAQNNKELLSRLFARMLQYINDIFNNLTDEGEIIKAFLVFDRLAPHFYDLAQTNKVSAKKFIVELLKEKHDIFIKKPKRIPDLDTLIFFKLVSLLYPTSDFRHPVTTPSLIFMAEILTLSRFDCAYSISRGLFITSLILEYTVLSKRLVPAAINFLRGIIYLCANTSILNPIQVVPPFRLHRDSKILNLEDDCSKMAVEFKMAAKDLAAKEVDNDLKIRCLLSCIVMLKEFFDYFNDIESQQCLFEPHISLVGRIDLELYPKKVSNKVLEIVKHMKESLEVKTFTPLSQEKKKPKVLRMYEPDIQEVFTGSKSSKLSREQAERSRLQSKYKREMKGALREIRRDKAYVASVKIRQKIHSDNIRKDKVKQIYKDASIQQGELNQLKRMK